MAISMRDLDSAFQGAGQNPGLEIWRIENFCPVPVPKHLHGKFFTGDSYLILKTTVLKSGALGQDIHYWLGKDTSQDEAGAAAIKAVELDATLGGRAVQYREVQGQETVKFLSYFRPCIIPQQGGIASGFKHAEVNESNHETRLYLCKGKHIVRVKEVLFARSTLNHDDVFILDTESKIFQFNGSNSSIQERAKALEVVQYIKDTFHDGKCEVAAVDDGRMMADAAAGEFWAFFGGFAPLPRKTSAEEEKIEEASTPKLLCVDKGKHVPIEADSLSRELLQTNKCYLLDCGIELFVWIGKNSPLEERKNASSGAEELVRSLDRPKAHVIRVIEGFETVMFRSKFDSWPQATGVAVSEDGRGKVAALLKRQGLNVSGLVKDDPHQEEPQPYIDCTGDLQVWHVNGKEKILLSFADQSKFYTGDCYIFQYSYPGEDDKEEYLIGTWFGKKSIEEERAAGISLATKMVESLKSQAVQARLYEGKEPIQFLSIFQSFIVYKGGVSSGYKNYITENDLTDETYSEDGTALFRIQGSGPDNMQAIQVETAASSLNSSYCYILHSDCTVFTWYGSLTTSEDHDIVERQLDIIKPNMQSKLQKEGTETEQFWDLLGDKCEYPNQKITKELESDPHLFSCAFSEGNLKATEIFNFIQDDLMTEEIFILDCHSDIFIWIGLMVNSKNKSQALDIGEKFIERDLLMEKLSRETPIFVVKEGGEPPFFTRFFTWDSAKSAVHGNSYERKFALVKNGVVPMRLDKNKRRIPSHGGRSSMPEKSQRSRSVSFSPERLRQRGKSPAFSALAATFESSNARNVSNSRNLSTPPPLDRKIFPKSIIPSSLKLASRSEAIASLTATFEQPVQNKIPRSPKKANRKAQVKENDTSLSNSVRDLTINEEDAEDDQAEEQLPIFPFERLTITSSDPVEDIDVTKREAYLSKEEFNMKFGMTKSDFYKLPKWKANKLKMAVDMF